MEQAQASTGLTLQAVNCSWWAEERKDLELRKIGSSYKKASKQEGSNTAHNIRILTCNMKLQPVKIEKGMKHGRRCIKMFLMIVPCRLWSEAECIVDIMLLLAKWRKKSPPPVSHCPQKGPGM